MPKEWMIEALGEDHLRLPGLVARALAANDQVKYLLTLLQTARAAADDATVATSLREERLASGEARAMLAPLTAAHMPAARELAERIDTVSASLSVRGDLISSGDVALLSAGRGRRGDSLHLVVMEAHRELNALQARIATDSIDGARVHDLGPGDRELVAALMRGLHSTERLKFDHPGLGTIATRTGPILVLQNDLGTTDAHVVVIRVTDPTVTITYTDERAAAHQVRAGWPRAWPHGPPVARRRPDREHWIHHRATRWSIPGRPRLRTAGRPLR